GKYEILNFLNISVNYDVFQRFISGFSARNIQTSELAAIKIVKLDPGRLKSLNVHFKHMTECDFMYVLKESLKGIIKPIGSLKLEKLLTILRYCTPGLHHLHETGKMHRDIKGANILLTERGDIKLGEMAPEVAAVEKKGGYNHLCDIWAVGITAIELAELQPPMFDLHPMRALMLMSKSSFQPPKLKEKAKWSAGFHSFVKMALNKNPRKRPSAETLLQHPFVTQLLTRNLIIELLDLANNPELHSSVPHSMDDSELEIGDEAPDKIQSAGKRLPAERTVSEEQCEFITHTLNTSLYLYDIGFSLSWVDLRFFTHPDRPPPPVFSLPPPGLSRCSATQDISQRCSDPRFPSQHPVPAERRPASSVSSPKRETPLSPEWSTLRKKTEDSRADCHGLPPTPQVHMGACFTKVFNGCPLKIHCAATWILPKTKDQHLILGAEEGIYTLNLNELHEDTLEKLLPQRCTWLYVMNNVLMSVSGKSSQLCSHSLTALFEQKGHVHKRHGSLSLSTNRFAERIIPRKFAISVKIPDTKGCRRCGVARNPYTDSTFLCAAVPSGLVLLLWYEPLQKFMHLKHISVRLPDSLPIFELLVLVSDEFPQLCVGVRESENASRQLHFDIIELNDPPAAAPDNGALNAVQITQLDRDTVLIAVEKMVKIVDLKGLPSREMAAEISFDFRIETLVCLQDSVLAFWKHGLKGRSYRSDEITQEITDESRVFRVLGTNRDIILQSTPTDDPSALSNLYILTGHESSY
uniref:Mitogen-activated protein kinase kinase kinase kinase n=2 Tax=Cyprinodon variegatus TaxID=28743 RepID=A0A3Q2EEH5_CYPVA